MLQPLYHREKHKQIKVIGRAVGVFCSLLAVNVILQTCNRAYLNDFGGHPDEASHVVTGLMVRDYLAGGFLESANPLHYAEAYYEAYPKVALGHYPPVFYAVTGVWLLFGVSTASILFLAAALTSFCGLLTFLLGSKFMGRGWALGGALLFTFTSLAQRYTSVFMSDMLLLAGCLLSAAAFIRFMDRGRGVDSLLFGVLAAITVLTKSSGLLLGMVPIFALFYACKVKTFRSRELWLAPIAVVLLTAPWLLITYHITAEGAIDAGIGSYMSDAVPFFGAAMWIIFGPLLLILVCGEILYCTINGAIFSRGVNDSEAVMIALAFSGLAFYLVVPAGLEQRYLLVIVPAVMLLGLKAVQRICCWVTSISGLRGKSALITQLLMGITVVASIGMDRFEWQGKDADGFREIIAAVTQMAMPGEDALLVVSDARGEGAMIAASALASNNRPKEGVRVHRGTKMLSSSDWLGRNYRSGFNTVAELRDYLTSGRMQFLALDLGVPDHKRVGYHDLVGEVVADHAADFTEVGRFPTRRTGGIKADVVLYRLKATGARKREKNEPWIIEGSP
ncbi:MAG: glycosyltransferase family 39 protein [Verrucomicrobiales bacterium]